MAKKSSQQLKKRPYKGQRLSSNIENKKNDNTSSVSSPSQQQKKQQQRQKKWNLREMMASPLFFVGIFVSVVAVLIGIYQQQQQQQQQQRDEINVGTSASNTEPNTPTTATPPSPPKPNFPARSESLPLLDQLFPSRTLDSAWEEYPLFSTIYSEDINTNINTKDKLVEESSSNIIPTVYDPSKPSQEKRLQWAQSLISPKDLDTILLSLQHGSQYKYLRKIWRDGEEWSGILPNHLLTIHNKPQIETTFSLIVNALQNRWGPIANATRKLQAEAIPQHVSCNLYQTPPPPSDPKTQNQKQQHRQSGFESHWDWMDVLVVQISGTKLWSVAQQPHIQLSNEDQKYKPNQQLLRSTPRYQEFTLRPGDILYIPRGFIHNASTTTTQSLHLTFGLEHKCETTVEALVHHLVEKFYEYEYSGNDNDNDDDERIAIPSHQCTVAGGRNIPWKDVMHFCVAEVARRFNTCQHQQELSTTNKNNCILRRSVPLGDAFTQIAQHRQGVEKPQRTMLLEALDNVRQFLDPSMAARFIWRLETNDGESVRQFCHPYIGPTSTVPCVDALARLDASILRAHLDLLRDYAVKDFDKVFRMFQRYLDTSRQEKRKQDDRVLAGLGQALPSTYE